LSAVYGGAQSLHTNGFDEALALPTERSAMLALRTQQILMHEAGTMSTADPLGGSWYVEALTDELEARAAELIARIDELGGAVAAIEAGWVQQQIEESAFRWQREVEQGERVIVGVNRYVQDEPERIELHRLDPAIERTQQERTQALRARRDAAAVETAVAEVRRTAESEANLLPGLREALAARATVGELCGALRGLWGTYDAR
jgi:methylmalonyl-CoA mutase N-terminal domain/subunit